MNPNSIEPLGLNITWLPSDRQPPELTEAELLELQPEPRDAHVGAVSKRTALER